MKNEGIGHEWSVDKSSPIPVYYQLARAIEKDIVAGRLRPGESLPPEHDTAARFGISRMTVRRAYFELISAGMVYSERGKGTFIARPKLDDVEFELDDFDEEMSGRGMSKQVKLLSAKIVRADDKLAEKLTVAVNTRCLHFKMLTSVNNDPLVYENKFIVYTKQSPILEQELKDPSLSNLANISGHYLLTTGKRIFRASIVTEEEAALLKVNLHTPVFLVEHTVYDNQKQAIGWGKSVYRGDRYRLTSYTGWNLDDKGNSLQMGFLTPPEV